MSNLQLNFREYGSHEPTLVILHGVLGSAQNWQRVAKALGESMRVLVLDQRNHGNSPHTATHTIDDLREDFRDFFEHKNSRALLCSGIRWAAWRRWSLRFIIPSTCAA